MARVHYSIFTRELTNAGSVEINGTWGLIAFIDAADVSGNPAPSAKVRVRFGSTVEDDFPLRIGGRVRIRETIKVFIEWDAQPGVTATFGLSENDDVVDWATPVPAQLGTISGTVEVAEAPSDDMAIDAVSVGTSATQLLTAAAGNAAVLVKNIGAADIFVGPDNTVTTADGFPIAAGETLMLSAYVGDLYGIVASGTVAARVAAVRYA